MKELKSDLADTVSSVLEVDVGKEDIEIPNGEHGDLAYPAMKAASALGKPPKSIAEEAAEQINEQNPGFVAEAWAENPGYLNVRLDRAKMADAVEQRLCSDKMSVAQQSGEVLVEFASPNVAKPMHVGHLRNIAIGDSIQRIMSFAGYEVTSENYVGDWGTQYGKLIYAYKNWGSKDQFEQNPMEHMYSLYKKFHEQASEQNQIEEKGRDWAAKIEHGDDEAVRLWRMFREASIQYHEKEFERMGVEFDRTTGESKVQEPAKQMVKSWISEGYLSRDEDGSVFYEFEDRDIPGTVLLKEDDSTLYATRDLYNLKKRNSEGFDRNLYVVASEQELHFEQVFAVADDMGLDANGAEHVSYGLLSLPEGSMSSRQGKTVELSDVLDEALSRAETKADGGDKISAEPDLIGLSAVKFANLSVSRPKNIEFSWSDALSFEGDSGPYVQYSNARAKSLVRKADVEGEFAGSMGDKEIALLKSLSLFPEKVEQAADQKEPAKIANYLSDVSEVFNSFYHECPVLDSSPQTMRNRLRLVELFIDVTDQGLELLGIEPLDRM